MSVYFFLGAVGQVDQGSFCHVCHINRDSIVMLIVIHVTALVPLLINYASACAEFGPQGQSLPALTDTVTDGALGL